MAVGDGSAWDETTPVDATLVSQVDDYERDLRIGVRSRMAFEHEWPSSQSATAEAGKHKFITLQNQAAKPTVSGTQIAAVYTKTNGSGLQELFWENEAGTELQLTNRASLNISTGSTLQVLSTSNAAATVISGTFPLSDAIPQTGSGGLIFALAVTPTSAGHNLEFTGVVNITETANSSNLVVVALFKGTTADAIACWSAQVDAGGPYGPESVPINHIVVSAATTGAITYYIRAGADAGASIINGGTSSRLFGGAMVCRLTIKEIKA